MEPKNVTIALFTMIGILIISNFYTMYQLYYAMAMIATLVEYVPR